MNKYTIIIIFLSFLKIISNDGNKTKTPIIANNIAIDVNIPNITVGMKLERLNIENPTAIVIDVVNTAKPALKLVKLIDSIKRPFLYLNFSLQVLNLMFQNHLKDIRKFLNTQHHK